MCSILSQTGKQTQIIHTFLKSMVQYHVHKSPALVLHENIPQLQNYTIHFNIIFTSVRESSKSCIPFWFAYQRLVCASQTLTFCMSMT
jgi:hypothetical protein